MPTAVDLEDLNQQLHRFCISELDRTVSGQKQTIGERFAQERQYALPMPAHRFDPCVSWAAVADKYQTVVLDNNRYSVPRDTAFCPVTVKAYVDRVVILQSDRTVAEHRRSFGRGELVLDPLHYLAALRVRPGALDHSGVFKDWKLPAVFEQLRHRLEREHGPRGGVRHYVRVLQLLGRHPAPRVVDAIGRLWHRVHLRAEDLEHKTESLAAGDTPVVKNASPSARNPGAPEPGTHVPPPDLRRFNQLMPSYTQGETL